MKKIIALSLALITLATASFAGEICTTDCNEWSCTTRCSE